MSQGDVTRQEDGSQEDTSKEDISQEGIYQEDKARNGNREFVRMTMSGRQTESGLME